MQVGTVPCSRCRVDASRVPRDDTGRELQVRPKLQRNMFADEGESVEDG